MSVNKVILIGNVGRDPEIVTFDNGNKVANLSLATSERWTNKSGEKQEATEWHNLAVFGKLADIVEKWVKKGQQLYIEGKIKSARSAASSSFRIGNQISLLQTALAQIFAVFSKHFFYSKQLVVFCVPLASCGGPELTLPCVNSNQKICY